MRISDFINKHYEVCYKSDNIDSIEDATLFLIAETHNFPEDRKTNALFIDTFADSDSIVFVESFPAMQLADQKKHTQVQYLKKEMMVLGWDTKRFRRKDIGFWPETIQKRIFETFQARNNSLIEVLKKTADINARRFVIAGEFHLKELSFDKRVSVEPLREYLKNQKAVILLQKINFDNLSLYDYRVEKKHLGFSQKQGFFHFSILITTSLSAASFALIAVFFRIFGIQTWIAIIMPCSGVAFCALALFIYKKNIEWQKKIVTLISI